MWIDSNNNIIKTPKTMVIDGTTYPRNIFKDKELLASLGILPYSENKVDSKYYWQGERTITDNVGNYAAIPRDIDTLKATMLSTINSQVSSKQGSVDWYWNRASKGGKAVPTEVQEYVDTLYSEQATKEAEVQALVTLDDIITYENTPYIEVRKVKHTSEDGTETYGPETESSNREINMLMHWSADPSAKVDPAFVSLTKE